MTIKIKKGKISCGCLIPWKIGSFVYVCGKKDYTCDNCELRQEGYDLAMKEKKK